MRTEILLSILFCGSATVCAGQELGLAPTEAAAPASAPPAAELPTATTATDAMPQPADASAPLVVFSGSMTKSMTAMSPGKAAFALVGAVAMIAEGEKIIKDNNVIDPSQEVARDVASELARLKSARTADAPLAIERKGLPKPAALVAAAPEAAYAVDVDSGWVLAYFPVDWAKYHVTFLSNMRVVDAKTKTVIAKAFCNWDGEKHGDPRFTRDELLDDSAKGLKAAVGRGADYCRGEFKAKLAETMAGGAGTPKTASGF